MSKYKSLKSPSHETLSLNRRIRNFYLDFNDQKWEACFDRLDPKLREGRVDHETYVESLSSFFDKYGPIEIESLELKLYLTVKNNQHDDRPFAYGLLHWQDHDGRPHVLRERWVKSEGAWYTRMVGLI